MDLAPLNPPLVHSRSNRDER